MGRLKALLLAGAAALGAAGSAEAADLPLPAPAFEPGPVEPVEFGGWYLRGDVGVGVASKPDIRSTFAPAGSTPDSFNVDQQNLGDSAFVGAGVGYQLNNWFRFDVTGEYRTAQHLGATESYNAGAYGDCLAFYAGCVPGARAYDIYTGTVQSTVALANAYVDVGTWRGFTPFIGGGIGGSFNRVSGLNDVGVGGPGGFGNGGFGFARDKSSTDLAYAAMAGISYAISPNLKLELAYRYLNMGTAQSNPITCTVACPQETQKYKLESQDIKLGMRWMFSDIAPVQPAVYAPPPPVYAPPPLVRKD